GVKADDGVIRPTLELNHVEYPRAHGEWNHLERRVNKFASIGEKSVINPGVTIGENALIGAGSVVTRDIPDNAIAFGNPARVVSRKVPLHVTSTRPRNTRGSLQS